jgi:germination protein M
MKTKDAATVKRLAALVVTVALAASASACGGTEEPPDAQPAAPPPPAETPPPPETATTEPAGETKPGETAEPALFTYEVWLARGDSLFRVQRSAEATPRVAATAIASLLEGPTAGEAEAGITTAIPAGTQLLGVSVQDRIATADLSGEYQSGGGSLSIMMRLAQLVYTLTQFPTVDAVRLELDGEPVEVFSGEGLVLENPVGRNDFEELLPAILVEQPAAGAPVASPVTISGTANVFEANVTVEILDADGNAIASEFTTATCGTGCRGDFALDVAFSVATEQQGTIVVHDDDAAGTGTPPHVVEIPIVLLPDS